MIKKRSKVLISFLFALIFVFQLALPVASATDDSLPQEISLSTQLSAQLNAEQLKALEPESNPEAPEIRPISPEMEIEALKPFGIKLGEEAFVSPAKLSGEGILRFTVPADYYISKLFIHDSSKTVDVLEESPVNLMTLAAMDPETKDFMLDTSLFFKDGKFNYELAAAEEGVSSYTMEIELSRLDCEKEVTITVEGSEPAAATPEAVAPAAPAAAENVEFINWIVSYKNGFRKVLNPGEPLEANISCTLSPNYKYSLNIKVNDLSVTKGDELNFSYTSLAVPEGLSLQNVGYVLSKGSDIVANEDIAEGESYSISMNFDVFRDGKQIPESNLAKNVTAGTLSVAAPVVKQTITVKPASPQLNAEKTDFIPGSSFSVNGFTNGESLVPEPVDTGFSYTLAHRTNAEGKDCVVTVLSGSYTIKANNGDILPDSGYEVKFIESDQVLYEIPAPELPLTAITVKPVNVSKEYNGSPQTAESVEITSGALKEGDKIQAQISGSATEVTLSPVETVITSFDIYRGEEKVTSEYNVSTEKGSLNIVPKNLKITAFSGEVTQTAANKEVFAKDQSSGEYTNGYKADGLLPGHVLKGLKVTGSGTAAGTVDTNIDTSALDIVVKDSSPEKSVKNCYKISTMPGSMKIIAFTASELQRGELTFKPVDIDVEYDGKEHKPLKYEFTGTLAEGDKIDTLTISGASANVVTNLKTEITQLVIKDSSGNDVTAKYAKITKNPGYITIKPHTLKLTAISAEITQKEEGQKICANGYGTKDGSFKKGLKVEGLLSGHKLSGVSVTGCSTAPGSFTSSVDISKLKLTDASDIDIKSNYKIETVNGSITVKAPSKPAEKGIPFTITAKDAKWTYDGKEHQCREYTADGLKDGDKIKSVSFDNNSSIINAGTVENKITNVIIVDKNDKPVSAAKYSKTIKPGTLSVSKYDLTVTAESASKSYDGKALINKNVSIGKLANPEHKIQVVYTVYNSKGKALQNPPVDVGSYTKKVTKLSILDGNKQDVTDNYNIKKVDGTLTIKGSGSGTQNESSGPQTGDESNLGIWIGILAASAVLIIAVAVVVIMKNKKASELSQDETEDENDGFEIDMEDFKDSDSSDNDSHKE